MLEAAAAGEDLSAPFEALLMVDPQLGVVSFPLVLFDHVARFKWFNCPRPSLSTKTNEG